MIYRLTFTLLIVLTASRATTVSGYVRDSVTGKSISNANVYIRELDAGTTSNFNGYFLFNINLEKKYHLEISHIGYKKQLVPIEKIPQEDLIILLKETFYEMNDIVVTGTRTPKILQDVPVETEVINKDKIKNSGVQNVGELLALRSGVSVSSSVAGGSIVSIMGMDSKYILILVDGQPIVGKFNSRVSLDQIPIQSIKKIEIIKGPNSSLYGSEAMGGVINIITNDQMINNLELAYRFDGGDNSFNPINLNMGNRTIVGIYADGNDELKYMVSVEVNHINVDKANQYIELDEISKNNLTSQLQWVINDKQKIKTILSGLDNVEASHSSTMDTDTRIIRKAINVNHDWQISPDWTLTQFYRASKYTRRYQQIYPNGDIKSDDLTGENESEIELIAIYEKNTTTINVGTEVSSASYKSDRISGGEKLLDSKSIYAQLDFTPFSNWNFVLGSRVDNHSESDPIYSPRIAVMYSLSTRWKFRGMWGTGFRMPTFMDRYIDWYHYQFGYTVIGNPDIKPETSEGYSLGFEYYHSSIYRVSCRVYRTSFINMIDDYILPTNGHLSYRNIDRVQYTGAELQGSFNMSNDWIVGWGINWVNNIDMSTDKLLSNTQPFSSNINITHKLNILPYRYMFQLKWIGPYYPLEYIPESNEFVTSSTKRKSQIFFEYVGTWNLKPSIAIESGIKNILNITNAKYGPFIGRTYYVKFKYTINQNKGNKNEK